MATSPEVRPEGPEHPWFIVGRWLEYEGEGRANLLRLTGIALFYLIQLATQYGFRLPLVNFPRVQDHGFHRAVTALAVAWTIMSLGVLLALRSRFFPSSLKYLSTGADFTFLTALLMMANGPRSPLVVIYFLILALAALRFSLALVQFATLAAVLSYLTLITYARWSAIDRAIRVPRYQEAIVLLAIILTGLALGQILRRVRTIADQFAKQIQAERGII